MSNTFEQDLHKSAADLIRVTLLVSPKNKPMHLCSPIMESEIPGFVCIHACTADGSESRKIYFQVVEAEE